MLLCGDPIDEKLGSLSFKPPGSAIPFPPHVPAGNITLLVFADVRRLPRRSAVSHAAHLRNGQ